MILERDGEQAAIDAVLADARRGEGGMLVLEGPAGIGKTALLRRAAATAGFRALSATALPLDSELAFGLVHRLLGPVAREADDAWRERMLAGAAGRAATLLLEGDGSVAAGAGQGLLHALYRLCANLAEETPVLLVVDDLQWADERSLRFLGFLSRRLDGLAVAVLAATRPRTDAEPLGLGSTLRLEPLSASAATRVLARALGGAPDAAFAAACHSATGGNPLLLRELARAAADHSLSGAAGESSAVVELGSVGVTGAVERRLDLLGPVAVAVTRAAAVYGPHSWIEDLAVLAGVNMREAVAALARAGTMEAHEFVHPLVREAVLAASAPEELLVLHSRAAARLKARAARPAEIAAHLLHTRPAGVVSTVHTLRTAARAAAEEGALDLAVAYLRRALEEPPPPDRRAPLVLELGELEADHGDAGAAERLTEAIASGDLTPDETARGRAARARQLLVRDPLQAADELQAAVAEAEDADIRLRVQSLLYDVTAYVPELDERRPALLESDPSPVVLAHRAVDDAYRSAPAGEVRALAVRALEGGELLRVVGPQATYHLLVMALRHAEQPALADEALKAGEAEVRRLGSRFGMYFMDHARAYWELMYGSVTAAEAHARSSLAITEEAAIPLGHVALVAMLSEVLIERGHLDEAWERVSAVALSPAIERVISGSDLISARAELHRLAGRLDEAERDARRAGTPGTLGMLLRVHGRIDGPEVAREAVRLLAGSALRLELARALLSAAELDRAYAEASRLGAAHVAGLAVAAGARASAAAALTPDERRVAGLAADGLGDREIAETLWVTQRAVEQQLASVLGKLGVGSRDELARAL